ncbi:hypothetical protein [Phenylobacterium sp. J367]|uniref:hypothetical protein n=1 Tax=Phenylobacterium sp. J367 TaxID=2898435 RepID=UPI002151CFA9|nr:hypothetical protein [Phenylobacterium sp. J367]MCR5881253.1 hypothetical protein [Phenylobacterium sp. J367]
MAGSFHLHLSTLSPSEPDAVIQRAVDLAHRLKAELEVTVSVIDVVPMAYAVPPHFAASMVALKSDSRARGEELVAMVREVCTRLGVRHTVSSYIASQRSNPRLAVIARTHDLSVAGLDDGDGDGRRAVENLAFGSGRPVLVLPWRQEKPVSLGKVFVAWDHSEAAARTMAFALPLLKLAQSVDVVSIDAGKAASVPEGVGLAADYLKRHGVAATPRTLWADGRKLGIQLMETAVADKAGLLVMGPTARQRPRS